MDNKSISRALKLLGQLQELHGRNEFKSRSVLAAAFRIDKLPYPLSGKSLEQLSVTEGIGKSLAAKVAELTETGSTAELSALLADTPPGVVDLMGIKGLGPKKVRVIWKDLGIDNTGELLYACNENRLIEAKGFGLKTQEEIKAAIEFKIAGSGLFLYAQVWKYAEDLLAQAQSFWPRAATALTGQIRRKCEIVDSIDLLIGEASADLQSFAEQLNLTIESEDARWTCTRGAGGAQVRLGRCSAADFPVTLFRTTGTQEHVDQVAAHLDPSGPLFTTEEALYQAAGLPFIEPELREGLFEFRLAAAGRMPSLLEFADLRGSLHNHSTWSDGVHTLEEMALFCRDELQLDYFGISDHSRTAVYAKGLSVDRVLAQQQEIDALNRKLAPFRIFKGIESDILSDGGLDYTPEILETFDFVVASIHSAFRMEEDRATSRLIRAIENPYTTILGHPSGRLLLSRKGYPVDFRKVIDACAANGVAIEINANPLRLDMDWRWHQYAIEKDVMLSVNPDAHRTTGFYDMHYGVLAARKGGVQPENCLNTYSREEISKWFSAKKSR